MIYPAFAAEYDQIVSTSDETLDVGIYTNIGQAQTSIPGWIKNNAGWWADGQIDDNAFVSGIQLSLIHISEPTRPY